MEKEPIKSHEDLEVYQMAFDAAMTIFELSKKFPVEERRGRGEGSRERRGGFLPSSPAPRTPHPCLFITDQIRRSSRSVCANLAEAWRKRRYEAAFMAKLNDCEAEAAETQTWLKFAVKCDYLNVEAARELYGTYNRILGILVTIINNPSPWVLKR